MADEEKDEKKEDKPEAKAEASVDGEQTEESTETKKKKGISPIVIIVAALLSLVIFLGVFSYMMGVFDKTPEPTVESTTADAGVAEEETESAEQQFVSDFGRAAAKAERMQEGTADENSDGSSTDSPTNESEQLAKRRQEIAEAEAKLNREQRELLTLKKEVQQLLDKKSAIASERVLYLAKLLDGMKAEEMTGLVTELDNKTILTILPNMKPQNASKILALLPPARAAKIATAMVETNP